METGQKFSTLISKINLHTNQTNRLSVQISLTGLSFLVSNGKTKEVVFFSEEQFSESRTPEEILDSLIHHLVHTDGLQGKFEEVQVIYATSIYSCVPSSLFDENKLSEYLKFNAKILANDFIAYDTIDNHGITVVYIPFVNINNYLFETYGSFEYFHSTTVLVNSILNSEKNQTEPRVYLHVLSNSFDCIIVNKGKLQLSNTYQYKTPEDFIYYVLFCMEQLKLNPEIVETTVMGAIKKDDDIFNILYKYIRNVDFLKHQLPRLANEAMQEQFLLKTTL